MSSVMKNLENPELVRNFWTEISPNRIIVMPLILGAIYTLIYFTNGSDWMGAAKYFSVFAFLLLVNMWGTLLASRAVVDEVNNRTWTMQLMTPLTPGQMTVGKLFGSTVYPWYGGILVMTVYGVTSHLSGDAHWIEDMGMYIFNGVLSHGAALSFSMMNIRKDRDKKKYLPYTNFMAGFILGTGLHTMYSVLQSGNNYFTWYNISITIEDIGLITMFLFASTAVISVYRNIRLELGHVNSPVFFLIILFLSIFYFSGYRVIGKEMNMGERVFLTVIWSASHILLSFIVFIFYEQKNPVAIRLTMDLIKRRDWKRFFVSIPVWLVSISLLIILVPVDALVSILYIDDLKGFNQFFMLSLALFVMRDLFFFLIMNFLIKPGRADTLALIYLILLYILGPAIFYAAGSYDLLALLIPLPTTDWNLSAPLPIINLGSPLVQALILFFLTRMRWQSMLPEPIVHNTAV